MVIQIDENEQQVYQAALIALRCVMQTGGHVVDDDGRMLDTSYWRQVWEDFRSAQTLERAGVHEGGVVG